jgi:hypothetical protein
MNQTSCQTESLNLRQTRGRRFGWALLGIVFVLGWNCTPVLGQPFVHPGGLSTAEDLARMKAKVEANAQPWKGSYDILTANWHAQLSYNPNPLAVICRGGACAGMGYSEIT